MVKSQALRSRGDRQLDPRGREASSLSWTRAATRPPRPRRLCGGDPAGPAAPSESLFSRCDRKGRDPGNQVGPRPRGREPSSPRPGPARRRLPFPPRPQETSRHRGGKTPPLSSRPADPSHLDLPTPLSPMMRIFRVVSTSSSILTLLRTASSWPPLPLLSPSPPTGASCRACAPPRPGPPSFHTGCLDFAGARDAPVPPGGRALRLRKTRRSGLPSGEGPSSLAQAQRKRARIRFHALLEYFSCLKLT